MMMNHLTIVMSRLGPGIPMLQYRMLSIQTFLGMAGVIHVLVVGASLSH